MNFSENKSSNMHIETYIEAHISPHIWLKEDLLYIPNKCQDMNTPLKMCS